MADTHYLALYRKYRPLTFEDVRGRDTIVRTLKNQIVSGRIGHSYLFCGTRGTGKTTIAKIFAKAVNCEDPQDGSPCGHCSSCLAIAENANLNVVEMDAASNNGVDDIRNIIDQVSYSPTQGRYRVYIIDEVHMLSTPAFNALLKTLEEPPEYAIFILATTEPNRLPVTILSRCQRYDFGRLAPDVIAGRLREVCDMEKLDAEDKAIRYIASAADGSMRDGLSILDQCNAFNYGQGTLTYEKTLEILGAVDTGVFSRFFRAMHTGDAATALGILSEILREGREIMQFVTDYIWYLRNLMMLNASEKTADMLDVSADNLAQMLEDARLAELSELIRAIRIFSALQEQIRYAANRRILAEIAVIRQCTPVMDGAGAAEDPLEPRAGDPVADALKERIRMLEEKLQSDEQRVSEMIRAGGGGQGFSQTGQGYPQAGQRQAQPAGGAAQQAAPQAPQEPRKAPELPSAIPDDVRRVVNGWSRLLAALPSSYLKSLLQKANLSLGGGGQLLLVFPNRFGADMFNLNEHNRTEFENYLSEKTGKRVPVEYKFLDKGNKFTDNYVDLQDVIRMEIEIED